MEKNRAAPASGAGRFRCSHRREYNPYLQNVQQELAPKLAAHRDAIYLNPKLFARVRTVYQTRDRLHLDPESQRLVEIVYDQFVHAGAALSDADKEKLKKMNEEASKLEDEFSRGLLDATKRAAYATTDKSAIAGLTDAQIAAAGASSIGAPRSTAMSICRCRTQRSSRI